MGEHASIGKGDFKRITKIMIEDRDMETLDCIEQETAVYTQAIKRYHHTKKVQDPHIDFEWMQKEAKFIKNKLRLKDVKETYKNAIWSRNSRKAISVKIGKILDS